LGGLLEYLPLRLITLWLLVVAVVHLVVVVLVVFKQVQHL
jgi:hypothetical protein